MSITTINTDLFRKMFLGGAFNLASNKAWINELNVFPVPDGDTGTNMTMTVTSAVKEVSDLGSTEDMKAVCKAISSGSLRGARGNSGVILSQLFRGFCKIVRDHQEIDVPLTADAFDKAVETAYKAVMKPKEGTILTVAKGAAQKARELSDSGVTDFEEFIPQVISYADSILASTPDMLPVLKQAGVVDSGGQGLMQVLKGAYEAFQGKEVSAEDILSPKEGAESQEKKPEETKFRYKYVVEFCIHTDVNFNPGTEEDFKNYLTSIGENSMIQTAEKTVKVHVRTNDPGLVIQKGLLYGALSDITVVNRELTPDYHESTFPEQKTAAPAAEDAQKAEPAEQGPRKEIGIIAVAAGDGLAEIFKGLGADYVISGGQTMNPSTEDILNAVSKVNANTVIILPDNKNIILAANQAAALESGKRLIVIPTKNIPQGITAVINFMPDQDADVNAENMKEEISHVSCAEVTYAVRDTTIDDVEIHAGNMMAIGDAGILDVGSERNDTALDALKKMVTDKTELISIYYGADTTKEQAEALKERAQKEFSHAEVEVQNGGQPVYYYILSAE
ncbi:MAG: DAK2 domain-containing protein [Lachnospiraceae bacterium]|nr:DAK2 domain-containing protein [Lachnospiraceae bacterium]